MSDRYEMVLKVPVIRAYASGGVGSAAIRVYRDAFSQGGTLVLDVGEDHLEMNRHELMSLSAGIAAHYKREDERNAVRDKASAKQGPAPEDGAARRVGINDAGRAGGGPGDDAADSPRESPEEVSQVEAGTSSPAVRGDYPIDGNYN